MSKPSGIDWLTITREEGEAGWKRFYQAYMGLPLVQTKRLMDAVEKLGDVIVFESIVAASFRKLEGDPLPYIMAIAIAKFNEEVTRIHEAERYRFSIDKSKQRIALQNDELENKLEKAREISRGRTTR